MRIIAGKFRSRRLRSTRGSEIRPTSDRLRETLFNVLCAGNPAVLEGSVWVDLFAGTGAVGIEALSRGAASVYFVERSKPAAELIELNLRPLQSEADVQVLCQDVASGISTLQSREVQPDFIFLDPPYAMHEAYRRTLAGLATSSLSRKALVIVEHDRKFDPGTDFSGLQRVRRMEQGDAALSFYRLSPKTAAP
jgi:16S rRNA (guanine(966)-N(2))-methyltransferase RsmD